MNETDFHLNVTNPSDHITPAQAAELLEQAAQGETSDALLQTLEGGAPSAAPEPGNVVETPAAAPAAPTDAPDQPQAAAEGTPVIKAKDGVHTISYDKLVEARNDAATYRSAAQQAQAALAEAQSQLASYQQQAADRASAGAAPTQADTNAAAAQAAIAAGVSPEVFGDWSPEAMASGVQQVLAAGMGPVMQQMAEMRAQLDAINQASQVTSVADHYQRIRAAHPDADSIAESTELQAWINSKPAYQRPALQGVLKKGSAQHIIEFFTDFKSETGRKPAATPVPAPAPGAPALPDLPIPTSLTDFPSGMRGPGTLDEAMSQLSGPALVEALSGMTEQQRNDYIARNS